MVHPNGMLNSNSMQHVQGGERIMRSLVKNSKNLIAAETIDLHPIIARGRAHLLTLKQQSEQQAATSHVYLSVGDR
jgi:hypothetical protein